MTSDTHRIGYDVLIADTFSWLAHHGATAEPRPSSGSDVELLIHAPGQPDVSARLGDILAWDGSRISVAHPPLPAPGAAPRP